MCHFGTRHSRILGKFGEKVPRLRQICAASVEFHARPPERPARESRLGAFSLGDPEKLQGLALPEPWEFEHGRPSFVPQ